MSIELPIELDAATLEAIFGDQEAYCIRHGEEDEESVFPDGTAAFVCTNWATYVRRVAGERAKLYGFFEHDNPGSSIARDFGGHDFAVVDDRFIIDCWATDLGAGTRSVLDMNDHEHAADIASLYGDRLLWKRNADLESSIDAEPPDRREIAMAGTSFRIASPAPSL